MSGEPRRRAFRVPSDPDGLDEEVDEELRFHLERKAERLMAEGMGEEEAWAEARRRFGSVDRVRSQMKRQGEVTMMWDGLLQDARYALRQVLANPAFTLVTVLTLALGVGATTSIFSVVDGILFRPLAFPDPDELVAVWADWTRRGGPADEWTNFADYYDLKERARGLEAVAPWDGGPVTLTGLGEPEQVVLGNVSWDMLSRVLRVAPAMGRSFTAEDDVPGTPATVLLSDGFWRRALAADPDVVGSTLSLNDEPYTVIGVLPPTFEPPFMVNAELWAPLRVSPTDNYCGRGNACVRLVGRLADGTSLSAARTEAAEIAAQLEREHPENADTGWALTSLQDDIVADTRTGLLVLMGAVAFVLLIACVNVANLLLARATARGSELAVRSALGAARGRITRQLLTESALLAALGGAAGLGVAFLGTDLLVGLAPPNTPRIDGVAVDGRVLGFALLVTLLAGVIFGVVPALRAARGDLYGVLREGGRTGSGGGRGGMRARSALVVGQVALALVLLVGAGLLVRSFQNLRARDLGFDPENVLTLRLGLPSTRYPDADAARGFVEDLEARLGALPGVDAVGSTSWLPLTGFGSDIGFTIEGRPLPPPGQGNAVWFRRVTPGYPEAMGMRLVAGRWTTEADAADAPRVVVINEGLAERFFPGENPIGQRLNLNDPNNPLWREIVGVAAEMRHFGVRDGSRDALYLPYAQAPIGAFYTTLRSSRDPSSLTGEVRAAVSAADPLLAVAQIQPMETLVADALGSERFVTTLLGLFAAAALALAVVGLYGVVSYGVSQRLREMGVRLALGAEGGHVRGLVLRQSLQVVAVGLVVGVGGGLALTRLMEDLLWEVSAADPLTFAAVSVLLAAVATLASAIPARRAARVDPIRVLKAE